MYPESQLDYPLLGFREHYFADNDKNGTPHGPSLSLTREDETSHNVARANDMGHFTFRDEDYYWKIDFYDRNLEYHSPDPVDPSITIGVLTIMRVDEY